MKEVYGFVIVVMLENGPPLPRSPFKISSITKLSGSIIHYVQQHYTINIQKPLLIGRTIVVSSEKRTRENSKCIQSQVFSCFFFFTLKCTESSVNFPRRIFSLRRKTEQNGSPSYVCVYVYKNNTW